MNSKAYIEIVETSRKNQQEFFVKTGRHPREIEHYPICVWFADTDMFFRFQTSLQWFKADNGMTLLDLEERLKKDFSYIKSVAFYDETPLGGGILIK